MVASVCGTWGAHLVPTLDTSVLRGNACSQQNIFIPPGLSPPPFLTKGCSECLKLRLFLDNDDCSTKMSAETQRYIVETKVPLKGADSEFYASGTEQVYLLNSEERMKLDVRQTVRSTVAVINHKEASGKGSFYVIEQEIMPGQVLFSLKEQWQDSTDVGDATKTQWFAPFETIWTGCAMPNEFLQRH